MEKDAHIAKRKIEHIEINLNQDVNSSLTTGLENYRIVHQALPEISLEDVELSQNFLGKEQPVPLLVSSMTGGTASAARINHNLAMAAQELGLAMGVGSQRAAIEDPGLEETFKIRRFAPDILVFGNLGAGQLNYGFGLEECQRAVEMIEADALILHLNPLQEALQPEGNINFRHLIKKIAQIRAGLPVPIIIKEVGWGISTETTRMLKEAGVDAIDVAGAGGTSWSQVEMARIEDPYQKQTAGVFSGWGIPTAESILNVRQISEDLPLIASGGLKTGIDVAKCLALGANMAGMAGTFLKAANESPETALNVMKMILRQLQIAMFACGTKNLSELDEQKIIKVT
jgi:isopentenyl-diphosphate delta-isomerase